MSDEIILNNLAHLAVWVGWREEQRHGDATKVPYDPRTGKEAKSTNSATWATRGEAETWAITNRGGVGIVLSQLNGGDCCLCGIDLDTCRDPNTETFQDWAQEVIDRFATYTEVSPSGTGAKLFFTHASADLQAIERLFGGLGGRQFKNGGGKHCPAIEIYRTGRYFTVTDESIGASDIVRQVSLADLEWLICNAGPKFARKESQQSEHDNDQSRSGKAFRKGAALKAAGLSYDAMRDALLADEDPEIAEWARTKGLANGAREMHRVYDKGATSRPAPVISSAKALQHRVFPPIKCAVKGYVVEGVTILAGRPKIGKSWLALDWNGAIARGGFCFGDLHCIEGPVLYLALEDNERRLKSRLTKLLVSTEWPENFEYATEWPTAKEGGIDAIRAWVKSRPNARMVTVDVLERFRTRSKSGKENAYAADYETIKELQSLAAELHIAILIVTHLRKGADDGDPIDKISGTLGLSGGADAFLILDSNSTGQTIYGRGRDLEEIDKAIRFNRLTCRWEILYEPSFARYSVLTAQLVLSLRFPQGFGRLE